MIETYDLRKPEEESVSDFEYVYPETLEVENNIFTHVGLGLYMIAQEDAKNKLTLDKVSRYYQVCFAGFRNETISLDNEESSIGKVSESFAASEMNEEILFAYSKRYSCWNGELLKKCLLEKNSIIQEPPELKSKMEYVIARIKAAEVKNKWRESLISFDDLWSSSEKLIELDTPFEFGEERRQGKYIMLGGKVGTRVTDGVFKFKAPFEVSDDDESSWINNKSYQSYLPELPYQENAINSECAVLYEEIWDGGSISFMTGWNIYYLAFDKDSDYMKRAADFYGLKVHVFHNQPVTTEPGVLSMDEMVKEIAEEEKKSPKIDVEEAFRQAGYAEIFSNLGYKGDWTINYLKVFDFNSYPQKIEAKYAAFTETGVIHCYRCKNSVSDAEVLPYDILKYLRINVKVPENMACEQGSNAAKIGHTFITMNDDKELDLVGEDNVRLLKKLR